MIQSKYDQLPFLPDVRLEAVAPGITLSHPLTRRGYGPGFIVVTPHTGTTSATSLKVENGIPSPLMKWAEEGYVVVEITEAALSSSEDSIKLAIDAIASCSSTKPKDVVGIIVYTPDLWNRVAGKLSSHPPILGASVYANVQSSKSLSASTVPVIQHLAGKVTDVIVRTDMLAVYDYETAETSGFAFPFHSEFNYTAENVSHSRNLSFFKKLMNGPYFDLEALWDEHTYYEFENRSVECTMATMVQEPYVNHVTTLTGGIGRAKLTEFYRDHFIFENPADVETELISRSVGIDRVIDEFLFKCTHDSQIDWLAPGIPATGRKLVVPLTGVVNIRGDRLYHEHIWWDQGTVLKQLGLLPDYLPYPHPVSDIPQPTPGKSLEYCVPIIGIEQALKLRDKDALESNEMFNFKVREA